MITIIDYGMGNLRSVQKAIEKSNGKVQISDKAADVEKAEKIILPGVGAMAPAMSRLTELNLVDPIKRCIQQGKIFLGICLGFQLLFDSSEEGGQSDGLSILPGSIKRFTQGKVPHMGWNQIHIKKSDCPLFKNIDDKSYAYFCHSYYAQTQDNVALTSTDYHINFTSSVWRDNVYGVQFHPEKSQEIGIQMLKNFVEIAS